MAKQVTLADIARKSAVSTSTVSLVLRNKRGIPEETRQRVLGAAQTLGYRPKARSSLRGGVSGHRGTSRLYNLGLIVKSEPGLAPQANPFYSQVVAGIEDACRRSKTNLLYATLPVDDNNIPTEAPPLLVENHVEALLLVGAFVDETLGHVLGESPLPVVLVDAYSARNGYDAVVSDNFRGAYQAVSYLIDQGHTAIGMVGSHPGAYPSLEERRQGYVQALRDRGLSELRFGDSNWPADDVAAATRALLTEHPEVTAVFGANDHAALAALRAAESLGRRVPQELSLVGFDDIDLAQHVHPTLTTMHVDKVGMGRLAVQILMNRLEFPEAERVTAVISPRLIERASAAKKS